MECLFVPVEGRSFSQKSFYDRCGINTLLSKVIRPENGEDILGVSFLKEIEKKVKTNKPYFIVLDSVQSLITDKEAVEGVAAYDPGKQSALIGKFAKLMEPFLEINGSTLVILKQHRANMSMGRQASSSPQGGYQLEHQTSCEILLYAGKSIEIGEEEIGFKVKVAIEKAPSTKPTPYKQQGGVEISQFYLNGFSYEYNLVDFCCLNGVIEFSGAGWHTIRKADDLNWPTEDLKIQSRFNVVEEIRNQPDYVKWLQKQCESFYNQDCTESKKKRIKKIKE